MAGDSEYGATLAVNADGTIQYDPTGAALIQALDEGETLTDTFTYTITDQHGATDTATVSVVVQGADDARGTGDHGEVFEDGSRHASGQLTRRRASTRAAG